MAEVFVNKLTAANRQLRCAIRLFFSGEDELAIHTITAAAYEIICDLKSRRGRDEIEDYCKSTVIFAIRSFRRGDLPPSMTSSPQTMEFIKQIANQWPDISATSDLDDIQFLIPEEDRKKFSRDRKKIANFLKHANYDSTKSISMDEVDNLELLARATTSYLDIDESDSRLGYEGELFHMWLCAETGGAVEGMPEYQKELISELESLGSEDRLRYCHELLGKLNQSKENA